MTTYKITEGTLGKAANYIAERFEGETTFNEEFEIVQDGEPIFFNVTCIPSIMDYGDGGWRLLDIEIVFASAEIVDIEGNLIPNDFDVVEFKKYFF